MPKGRETTEKINISDEDKEFFEGITKETWNRQDKNEFAQLKAENDMLFEGNAQLTFQLNAIEKSMLKETDHVQELTQERSITRSALDDLIKSIDSIVENENQP